MSGVAPVSFALYQRDFESFAKALGMSFERYGFAIVADHGLDQAGIDAAVADAKAFFALPQECKQTYVSGKGGQRGYVPFGKETAKGAALHDLKEFWHVGRDLPPGHPFASSMPPNVWPREVPGFQPHTAGLFEALDRLGGHMLEAIAHYLGLPRDHFRAAVRDGNSILRLLHYPPRATEEMPGAGEHTDYGSLTILLTDDVGGLEVRRRDGTWIKAPPIPGAFVCNIGDCLMRWSNDTYVSTPHRVTSPLGRDRYSIAFFLDPNPDALVECLPGCAEARPPKYPPILAADYLTQRLVATYGTS